MHDVTQLWGMCIMGKEEEEEEEEVNMSFLYKTRVQMDVSYFYILFIRVVMS